MSRVACSHPDFSKHQYHNSAEAEQECDAAFQSMMSKITKGSSGGSGSLGVPSSVLDDPDFGIEDDEEPETDLPFVVSDETADKLDQDRMTTYSYVATTLATSRAEQYQNASDTWRDVLDISNSIPDQNTRDDAADRLDELSTSNRFAADVSGNANRSYTAGDVKDACRNMSDILRDENSCQQTRAYNAIFRMNTFRRQAAQYEEYLREIRPDEITENRDIQLGSDAGVKWTTSSRFDQDKAREVMTNSEIKSASKSVIVASSARKVIGDERYKDCTEEGTPRFSAYSD